MTINSMKQNETILEKKFEKRSLANFSFPSIRLEWWNWRKFIRFWRRICRNWKKPCLNVNSFGLIWNECMNIKNEWWKIYPIVLIRRSKRKSNIVSGERSVKWSNEISFQCNLNWKWWKNCTIEFDRSWAKKRPNALKKIIKHSNCERWWCENDRNFVSTIEFENVF